MNKYATLEKVDSLMMALGKNILLLKKIINKNEEEKNVHSVIKDFCLENIFNEYYI